MDHWYDDKGKERYDADLRTARKENLLPSVTSIEKAVVKNSGLDIYIENQLLTAAFEYGRPGSNYDLFKSAIKEIAGKHSEEAMERGTAVHGMIENYLLGNPVSENEHTSIFTPIRDWIDENVEETIAAEKVYVNLEYGYAGKADAVVRLNNDKLVIIDWKTQNIKTPKMGKSGKLLSPRVAFYDSFISQLAALEECAQNAGVMSVVISTNLEFPGVWTKDWTYEETYRGWRLFSAALELWKLKKKYEYIRVAA